MGSTQVKFDDRDLAAPFSPSHLPEIEAFLLIDADYQKSFANLFFSS